MSGETERGSIWARIRGKEVRTMGHPDLPYLEPIYLDNALVLNALTHFKGGSARFSERTETVGLKRSRKGSLSIPLAQDLVHLSVGSDSAHSVAIRQALDVAVGGHHMDVLVAAAERGLLHNIGDPTELTDCNFDGYAMIKARLKPIDFVALIAALRFAAPLLKQFATEFPQLANTLSRFGQTEVRRNGAQSAPTTYQHKVGFTDLFSRSGDLSDFIGKLTVQLQADLLQSDQIEMLMTHASADGQVFGTVSLDIGDSTPEKLQARLGYIDAVVIGKITRLVLSSESVPILQRTSLFQAVDLLMALVTAAKPSDGGNDVRGQMANITEKIEAIVPLYLRGPAVCVRAMSVCI